MKRGPRPEPIGLRVLNSVSIEDGGCWIWTRQRDRYGYGRLTVEGKAKKAHRVAYETFVGEIPKGHDVHHECTAKSCVNPAHLSTICPSEHGRLSSLAKRPRKRLPRWTTEEEDAELGLGLA